MTAAAQHNTASRRGRNLRQPSAFTLIEILVVIAVIAILVSVVVAVGSAVRASAQRQQTAATMKILVSLVEQYRTQTGRIDFTDMNGLLNTVAVYPDMLKTLNSLGTSYVPGSAPAVNDGFGNAILFTYYSGTLASGTAQTGTTSSTAPTITIATADTAAPGAYVGGVLFITGGTGVGQRALPITANDGAKLVTLAGSWAIAPTATTTYTIAPPPLTLASRAPYFRSYGPDGISSSDDMYSYDSP